MDNKLKQKALSLGASEFGKSNTKGKRFYVIYKGQRINFGLEGGQTFLEHKDPKKRRAWKARHSKVRDKQGRKVINLKTSASFWSDRILW
jgi:hypothetical protein